MKLQFCFLIVFCLPMIDSQRILILTPFGVPSHNILFRALVSTLSLSKNYTITLVTNDHNTSFPSSVRTFIPFSSEEFMDGFPKGGWPFTYISQLCCQLYKNHEFMRLMDPGLYELVIVNGFVHECLYGFLPKMKTPFIVFVSSSVPSYIAEPLGNFSPPSIVPLTLSDFSDKMSFFQRGQNLFYALLAKVYIHLYMLPKFEAVYRRHLGVDLPGVGEILGEGSLLLSNSHWSTNGPRPCLPDLVEVGGFHCRQGEKLPKNLEAFVLDSGSGVILFSLGSLYRPQDLSPDILITFSSVFTNLKERIIWKIDLESLPQTTAETLQGLKNCLFVKWMPQQDLLAHPKVKLLITQGGLLSIMEAVYHSVPVLGLPIGQDQSKNLKSLTDFGSGLTLDWKGQLFEQKTLKDAIDQILRNPRFAERMREHSKIFRDRNPSPAGALDYWVDYVIRHKGAVHLRSGARGLNIFQYYSLDVVTAFLACIFFARRLISYGIHRLKVWTFKRFTNLIKNRQSQPVPIVPTISNPPKLKSY